MKTFLNVLGAVLASILMPVLLCALIICPLADSVVSLTRPEKITELISDVDLDRIISAAPAIESALDQLGIEETEGMLELGIVGDFAALYLKDAEAQLVDGQKGSRITAQDLIDVLDENMEEVVGYIRKSAPEKVSGMTDPEIASEVRSIAEEQAPKVVEALPPVSEMIEAAAGITTATEAVARTYVFIKRSLMPVVYTVIILLSLLILACRAYHLEGTIWLGIDYLLGSAVLLVIALVSDAVIELLELAGIGLDLSNVISRSLRPFMIAYLVIGVAFIGAFVGVRIFIYKRRKKRIAEHNEQMRIRYEEAKAQNANPYSAQTPQYTGGNANPYSAHTPQYTGGNANPYSAATPQYTEQQYQQPQPQDANPANGEMKNG